jgi:hypothetical protein
MSHKLAFDQPIGLIDSFHLPLKSLIRHEVDCEYARLRHTSLHLASSLPLQGHESDQTY